VAVLVVLQAVEVEVPQQVVLAVPRAVLQQVGSLAVPQQAGSRVVSRVEKVADSS
jgi:hypothetical protein